MLAFQSKLFIEELQVLNSKFVGEAKVLLLELSRIKTFQRQFAYNGQRIFISF
jgi:hypothetical protein